MIAVYYSTPSVSFNMWEHLRQKLQMIIMAEICSGYLRQKLSDTEDDIPLIQ